MTDVRDEIRMATDLDDALQCIITHFKADTGTIHALGNDAMLHLKAAARGIPEEFLNIIRMIPVGKGMAGLAMERNQPVTACNIQTDNSGGVRPGAKATGMEGAIVVPIRRGRVALGALGVANRTERIFTEDETQLLLSLGPILAERDEFLNG